MMLWEDEIISNTEIHFSLMDRIRILFGRAAHSRVRTLTQFLPGKVLPFESSCHVDHFFRLKQKGGEEVMEGKRRET